MQTTRRRLRFPVLMVGMVLGSLTLPQTVRAQASFFANAWAKLTIKTQEPKDNNWVNFNGTTSKRPTFETGLAQTTVPNPVASANTSSATAESDVSGWSAPDGRCFATAKTQDTGYTFFNNSNKPVKVNCSFIYSIAGDATAPNVAGVYNSAKAKSWVSLEFTAGFQKTKDLTPKPDFMEYWVKNGEVILDNKGILQSKPYFETNQPDPFGFSIVLPKDSISTLTVATYAYGNAFSYKTNAMPEASSVLSFGLMLTGGGLTYWRSRRRRQTACLQADGAATGIK